MSLFSLTWITAIDKFSDICPCSCRSTARAVARMTLLELETDYIILFKTLQGLLSHLKWKQILYSVLQVLHYLSIISLISSPSSLPYAHSISNHKHRRLVLASESFQFVLILPGMFFSHVNIWPTLSQSQIFTQMPFTPTCFPYHYN